MPTVVSVLDFIPNGRRSFDEYLLATSDALRARKWNHVYVFSGQPTSAFSEKLNAIGVPWFQCPARPSVSRAIALGLELRRFRPDILQTVFMSKFHPSLTALKLASRARHLVVADHTSGLAARRRSAVSMVLVKARGRIAGICTSRFVTVSDFVRRRDVNDLHLPAHKMRVVYNGVNVMRYRPFELPNNAVPTIAFAGQLIPQKGVMTLLRAVVLLARDGVKVSLKVAGAGCQEGELRQYCVENDIEGHVAFLGQIDGIPELFSTADIVVVPSEWAEAFGYVVSEAMACGACLVASNAGGIPEVAGRDGEAALVFRSGDAADLAEKCRRLLTDATLRSRMRLAARERVVREFTLERMVKGYLDVYDELIASG